MNTWFTSKIKVGKFPWPSIKVVSRFVFFLGLLSFCSSLVFYSQVPRDFMDFFIPTIPRSVENPPGTRNVPTRNKQLAHQYLQAAVLSYEENDLSNFEFFLASVYEFDSNLSDSWYLSAHLALDRGFPRIAADLVEHSLLLNSFFHFSYEVVETFYISLLHRLKDYQSIVDYFYRPNSLAHEPSFRMVHPEQTFLLLDSLVRSALETIHFKAFRQGLQTFPDDPRIQVLQEPLGIPPSLRIEQFLRLPISNQAIHLQALELFISRLDSGDIRRQWIQQFIRLGGSLSDRMLRSYLEDIVKDELRLSVFVDDLLLKNPIRDIYEAVSLYQLLETTVYQARFLDALLNHHPDQSFTRDFNHDGIPEEMYQLNNGELIS